jgi:hypothetical protein
MSFIKYNPEDSVISSETVTRGAWTNDNLTLTSFYTPDSDLGTSYNLDVYDSVDATNLQFSIQYGNKLGTGYSPLNGASSERTPSRITYGQYRSLIYSDENSSFTFGSITSNSFWALSIARARFKESIKPGSLTLKLKGSGSGLSNLTLTDDSIISGSVTNFIGSNRYYTLISGSGGTAATSTNGVSGSYGLIFPDLGVILLNPLALSQASSSGGAGIKESTGTSGFSMQSIFNAINTGSLFTLQSQETVSSRYFFTRVKNNDFNYTTNPTIINDSGSLLYDTLINSPQTYITTVGMYNDNNELLGVAKLSRPLIKDFTKEALIRIKLDY